MSESNFQIDCKQARTNIRDSKYVQEASLIADLINLTGLRSNVDLSAKIDARATNLVGRVRQAQRGASYFDAMLQEYGLDQKEGVELMRLAESYLRTPDIETRMLVLRDRLQAGNWRAHEGASPDMRVNLATRALGMAKAWMGEHPNRRSASTAILTDAISTRMMQSIGNHFVLGESISSAVRRARSNRKTGYLHSFDMLGEGARTEEDAIRYFKAYKAAIEAIGQSCTEACPNKNSGVSVKLSALFSRFETAQKGEAVDSLTNRMAELCKIAKKFNVPVTIDAEEVARLDLSLDVFQNLLDLNSVDKWPGLGIVVQAYQKRALPVLEWILLQAKARRLRIPVRLVKGAYWDHEIKVAQQQGLDDYPVFTSKAHTDISYLACALKLITNTDCFYPQFATHNAHTVAAVLEFAQMTNVSFTQFEFQRLHGMGEALHDLLISEAQAQSRIYAPVGPHRNLLPYLVRRLLENGANSSFINRLHDPDIAPSEVAENPVTLVLKTNCVSHTSIPAPRDLFSGKRLSAEGLDLDCPFVAESLERSISEYRGSVFEACPLPSRKSNRPPEAAVQNPADRDELVGTVHNATLQQVSEAMTQAHKNWGSWQAQSGHIRSNILQTAANFLEKERDRFLALLVREAGKTIDDAVADWREAVDFLRFYGLQAESEKFDGRSGYGVIVCISPWNFPLAIFIGQIAGALAAGNAVVAKPAEQTPLIACEAVKLLHKAGVPETVLHVLPGEGADIGGALVEHPLAAGICFTGSTETAALINRTFRSHAPADSPLIAETGGINAMLVDSTAQIEQAVDDIVMSAFRSAGQRCSALRLLCVQDDIADNLLHMLAGAIDKLKLGCPSHHSTDIGPVIDRDARTDIETHISSLRKQSRLIAEAPAAEQEAKGTFIRPVAFEIGSIGDLKREIFGPVLHVVRFAACDFEKVVQEVNRSGYGLTMGLHTRIDARVRRLAELSRAGNIYVNRNQIGAIVGVQPFGGSGLSGTGPKAGGDGYMLRLSRPASTTESDGSAEAAPKSPMAIMLRQAMEELRPNWPDLAIKVGNAVNDAEYIATSTHTLPGPTGESNKLALKPRGIILCVGTSVAEIVLRAIATGNQTIACDHEGSHELIALKRAISNAGASNDLLQIVDWSDKLSILDRSDLSGVATPEIDETFHRELSIRLAQRQGPILPLLSMNDSLPFWCIEQTETINLTAAGGDVALLGGFTGRGR